MKLINTFVSKIKKRWNLFFNKSHFNSLDAMEIANRFHLNDEARKLVNLDCLLFIARA